MTFETLQFEVTDAISLLTLSRPATINALNQTMIAELEAVFDSLDGDEVENRNQAFMITALKANSTPPEKT